MKYLIKLIYGLFVMGLTTSFLGACSGGPASVVSSNPQSQSKKQNPQKQNQPRCAHALFESSLSKSELRRNQIDFLNQVPTSVQRSDDWDFAFSLNHRWVDYPRRKYPVAPIFRPYNGNDDPSIALAVGFPADFYLNIPQSLKDQLCNYDLNHLDLAFLIQSWMGIDYPTPYRLNAGYWAMSILPQNPRGTYFYRDFLMGIFNSEKSIDSFWAGGSLNPVTVHLHDALTSPNNGHVHFEERDVGTRNSLWTVVIDPHDRRAIVTLHWLVPWNPELRSIRNHLHQSMSGRSISLDRIIEEFNTQLHLSGSEMMNQLASLVALQPE